jgi:hypothetical protein
VPGTRWSNNDIEILINLHNRYKSISYIAKILDRNYGQVSVKLSRMGLTKQIINRRKPNRFLECIKLACEPGKSDRMIARELQTTHQEVFKARKKLGIISGIRPCWINSNTLIYRGNILASNPTNIQIAISIAEKWGHTVPCLRDEFLSRAMLCLVQCSRSFQKTKGYEFQTYLKLRLKYDMKKTCRNSVPLGYRTNRGQFNIDNIPCVLSGEYGLDFSLLEFKVDNAKDNQH